MKETDKNIILDIDKDRIKSILSETYITCKDILNTEFEKSQDEFVSSIMPYLDSNRVSIPVFLDLPSRKYRGMKIEVNIRLQKVFARIPSRSRNHPKQVLLNRYLKAL